MGEGWREPGTETEIREMKKRSRERGERCHRRACWRPHPVSPKFSRREQCHLRNGAGSLCAASCRLSGSGVLNLESLKLDGGKITLFSLISGYRFSTSFDYDNSNRPVTLAITMGLSPKEITCIFVSYYVIADILKEDLCSLLQNYVLSTYC